MSGIREIEEILAETKQKKVKDIREVDEILAEIENSIQDKIQKDEELQKKLFEIDLEIAMEKKDIENLESLKEIIIQERIRRF